MRPASTVTRILLAAAMLAGSLPTLAQGFTPGEETVFTVSYLAVPTGEGRIRVGSPEGDIWPVILQARTGGAASLLDIREHMVAYWDTARRLSRGSDLQAYEVGDFHKDSARFDSSGRQLTVVEQHHDKADRTVLDVPDGSLDLAGAFMWLRLQHLEVGSEYRIPVIGGTTQFVLLASVLALEPVRTPAGDFPSFKIRLTLGFDGKFSTKRNTFLWLSESAAHHLVKASADFAVGSVVAELKSYHPGGQVAVK
jgi:hypothetical protein